MAEEFARRVTRSAVARLIRGIKTPGSASSHYHTADGMALDIITELAQSCTLKTCKTLNNVKSHTHTHTLRWQTWRLLVKVLDYEQRMQVLGLTLPHTQKRYNKPTESLTRSLDLMTSLVLLLAGRAEVSMVDVLEALKEMVAQPKLYLLTTGSLEGCSQCIALCCCQPLYNPSTADMIVEAQRRPHTDAALDDGFGTTTSPHAHKPLRSGPAPHSNSRHPNKHDSHPGIPCGTQAGAVWRHHCICCQ